MKNSKTMLVVAGIDALAISLKEEIRNMRPGEKLSFEISRHEDGRDEWSAYKITDTNKKS